MKKVITIILMFTCFLVGCSNDKNFNNAMEMGQNSLLNHDYESALAHFNLALKENSDDKLANTLYSQTKLFIKGILYYENSDYDNALDIFSKVTSYYDGSELLSSKAKETIKEIEKHKELKDSINNNITLAKDYYSNKEYEKSLKSIELALDLITDNDEYKAEKEELIKLEDSCKESIEQIKLQEEEEKRKKLEAEKLKEQSSNSSNIISESQAVKIIEKYAYSKLGFIPNAIGLFETVNGKYHISVDHYDEDGIRCTYGWYWVDMKTGEIS